nr:MAG TPA: hypothetical protein [Caudoviricetes sp.]
MELSEVKSCYPWRLNNLYPYISYNWSYGKS